MAKPLSKLRKKICTEIHNNGGWPNKAEHCHLFEGKIEFFDRAGFYVKELTISTNLKELNQASRNEVTSKQYMQFMLEQNYFQTIEPEEDEPVKPAGLEVLLSAWKAANEVVTEQEEKLATAKKVADDAHKAVQNALSAYGWGKPSVTVTDAKDLLPGDRILCVGASWNDDSCNDVRIVRRLTVRNGHTAIHIENGDYGFEFTFVERPELA